MLEAIRDRLIKTPTELITASLEGLGLSLSTSTPESQTASQVLIAFAETDDGRELQKHYTAQLRAIHEAAEENVRLANVTSTRMGTIQQLCNERAKRVLAVHEELRNLPLISRQLRLIDGQIDKLQRFCEQTELAMHQLEVLICCVDGDRRCRERRAALQREPVQSEPPSHLNRLNQTQSSVMDNSTEMLKLDENNAHGQRELEDFLEHS